MGDRGLPIGLCSSPPDRFVDDDFTMRKWSWRDECNFLIELRITFI